MYRRSRSSPSKKPFLFHECYWLWKRAESLSLGEFSLSLLMKDRNHIYINEMRCLSCLSNNCINNWRRSVSFRSVHRKSLCIHSRFCSFIHPSVLRGTRNEHAVLWHFCALSLNVFGRLLRDEIYLFIYSLEQSFAQWRENSFPCWSFYSMDVCSGPLS